MCFAKSIQGDLMRQPQFKPGDVLYYVNPFVYIIDKILVEFVENEDVNGNIYYIDHSGAYLLEEHLFVTLSFAKIRARQMLDKFYIEHTKIITSAEPELDIEPND